MRDARLAASSLLLLIAACSWIAGCSPTHEEVSLVDGSDIQDDLTAISQARVLLGHQSVGRNLLAGLEALAQEAGVPLRILEIDGMPPDSEPGIFHSNIGRNGDPASKCEVFGQLLTRPERPRYDLAMMKFCYVDLGRDVDVEVDAMLERYTRTVREIREQRADVHLVHVTLPLMSDPPGLKTRVKRLIGYPTYRDEDNVLRNAYNRALREWFAGEPLFDLAAVEATFPDGSLSSFEHEGQSIHTLVQAYTDDGGHLNDVGRRRAAEAFVRTLAAVLRPSGGPAE